MDAGFARISCRREVIMRRWAALFVVLAVTSAALAAEGPQKIVSIEGVTEYRLANGARVLIFPDASRPIITVNMTVLVGSRHEGYGETGMAHLLEHMLFKGTPTFPDVPRALRDHGATFNGTTNADRTNYFETLPAGDDNLEFAIRLEADRLVHSNIKREDLVTEMTVVRNEFEMGENNPQRILLQRIHSVAYEWHNYGKATIGNRSDIERVPMESLQAFYRKHYQPDNVVLILAGKLEEEKTLALVEKYLGVLPRPRRHLQDTYTEEPPQDGERRVMLRRVGGVGLVDVAYHMPAATHTDWAPLTLLAGILTQQPGGRLYKDLIRTGKATSVSAWAGNQHDPSLFVVSAETEPGRLEEVRTGMLKVLEEISEVPFEDRQVEQARLRARRAHERIEDSSTAMAQALSLASALGDWRLLFVQRDRLAAVSTADVNRVARTYFHKCNRTVGLYVPEKEPHRIAIPAAPALDAIVGAYRGGQRAAVGEAFDPSPENLDARIKHTRIGSVRAGLLVKKNRGETVTLAVRLHYGNEQSLQGQTAAAELLPLLMIDSTRKHSHRALREEMERLGIRISVGLPLAGSGRPRRGDASVVPAPPGQLTLSLEARRSTLPAALELLGEVLREPALPAAELDVLRRRARAAQERMHTDPALLAANRLARALAPYPAGDVRHVPTPEEKIEQLAAVTPEQVRTLYEKQVGAGVGELVIVGDFDLEPALDRLRTILADWKSRVPVHPIERRADPSLQGFREEIRTPDKANAVFLAGLAFPLRETDPDFAALQLGSFLFGGGALTSRLGTRLRQKEGLSYSVASFFSAAARDPWATFHVRAITNPGNMDRLEKAALEELTAFLSAGPSDQELNDARKAYLEMQKISRTSDGTLVGQMLTNLYLGRTFAHARQREKQILELRPADMKMAFRKHIDPKKLVILRAGDFTR